jgi:enamine deaminase RidA (YjgF/YER057c/UK114 family)
MHLARLLRPVMPFASKSCRHPCSPSAVTPAGWVSSYPGFSEGVVVTVGSHRVIHISGQVAMRDGAIVGSDVAEQADVCYERIAGLLAEVDATMRDLVETRIYLLDATRLTEVAAIRGRHLADPLPASTAVGVNALAVPGALVEIAATAVVPLKSGLSETR